MLYFTKYSFTRSIVGHPGKYMQQELLMCRQELIFLLIPAFSNLELKVGDSRNATDTMSEINNFLGGIKVQNH